MSIQVRNKGQTAAPTKQAAFTTGVQQEPAPTDLSTTNLKSTGPVPVKPTRIETQAKVAQEQLKLQVKANQVKALGRTVTARTTEQAKKDGERALQEKRKVEDLAKKQTSELRKADNKQRGRQQRLQRNLERKEQLQKQQSNVARVEAQDNIQLGFLGRVMNMLAQSLTAKAEVKTTTSTTSDLEAAQIAQKGTHVGERESDDRLDSVIRPEDEQQEADAGAGSLGIDDDIEGGAVALEGPVQGNTSSGMTSSEIFMQQMQQQNVSAQLEGELNLSEEFIKFFLDLLSFPEIQKLLQERMALEAAAIMRAVLFQLIEKLQAAGIDPQLSKLLSSVNSGEYPVTTNQVSELMNLLANQVQRVDVQDVLRQIDTMDDPDERTVPIYRSKPAEEYLQEESQTEEVTK